MVTLDSLDKDITKLYLGGNAQPMWEIWPNLWNNSYFVNAKDGHIFNAFMVMDSQSDYFCLTTKASDFKDVGACYDIDHQISFRGYTYEGTDDNVVLSANEPIIYYVMHKVDDTLQLCQFRFDSPSLRGLFLPSISQSSPWRNLCQSGSQIYSTAKQCDKPFSMPVLKGFLNGEMFYLFGKSHVIIFSVKVYTEPNVKYKFVQKQYSQFILCSRGDVDDEETSGNVAYPLCLLLKTTMNSINLQVPIWASLYQVS